MKKRVIKKKKESKKKTSYSNDIKGRIRIHRKMTITTKLAIILGYIAVVGLCYLKLGKLLAAAVAFLLLVVGVVVYIS